MIYIDPRFHKRFACFAELGTNFFHPHLKKQTFCFSRIQDGNVTGREFKDGHALGQAIALRPRNHPSPLRLPSQPFVASALFGSCGSKISSRVSHIYKVRVSITFRFPISAWRFQRLDIFMFEDASVSSNADTIRTLSEIRLRAR